MKKAGRQPGLNRKENPNSAMVAHATSNLMKLSDILLDQGTQARVDLDGEAVQQYAEAMELGAKFPPIVVFQVGEVFVAADGFHRIAAATKVGWRDFPVDIHQGTLADALWFALGANRENATRMKPEDKRHAILRALETWPNKPSGELAEHIGCSDQYVLDIREQVPSSWNLPSTVTGRDGKRYPARRGPNKKAEAPTPDVASKQSHYEASKAMAIDGAAEGLLRRLPRKKDDALVTNAIYSLAAVCEALSTLSVAGVAGSKFAGSWHEDLTKMIRFLQGFNRTLVSGRTE